MPELPEVESVRRQLAPRLVGCRIDAVWADPKMPRYIRPAEAAQTTVHDLVRRGKYLIADLGAPHQEAGLQLILHLGMTGVLRWRGEDGWDGDDYVRATFAVTTREGRQAHLDFRDVRRFGTLAVVPEGVYDELPTLASLGPEPLSDAFDRADFAAALHQTGQQVKPFLLSQRPVAGVGNIYADEALWRARIHPTSRRVGRARANRLHQAIVDVLAESVEREGTTFSDYQMVNGESGRNADYLVAYGQEDRPCPRCGTPMRKTVVGGRGTTYCPRCQR
ncbi:bifunctional DNA-formamidopyrimidine glycosylase/DNA-(apurinic or apyrimidinic site) lyase [Euzebya tangerina]|uniref:bifunctional DNA-formamidopyrimidine glycosylase/DNA-(apurinic or apyrimidinic site) lyase n=1 Tax=Euzebya tangerina TaxID=591198 RepID=UPI000E31206D|nr:bifunctional DNA-formamidopyrimidine glycosylase/DNA-(apurinic or apyrimidinic site) lyase [Euzebya tangerina]